MKKIKLVIFTGTNMQLVLRYTVSDGYTYWYDVIIPFYYESAEQAIIDFEYNLVHRVMAFKDILADFTFVGHTFSANNFYVDGKLELPDIMTIDEWFNSEPGHV